MRAVVQRVTRADVTISGEEKAQIGKGLLILLGVMDGDNKNDVDYIVKKSVGLRVFEDENGKMNVSAADVGAELLIVSQFTLLGDVRKGYRPSFTAAGRPEQTKKIYEAAVEEFKKSGLVVKTGEFGAYMKVGLINDGPVTILLDSRKVF